jgi:hypothetical protein
MQLARQNWIALMVMVAFILSSGLIPQQARATSPGASQSAPLSFAAIEPANLPEEIENPDFETGDLSGWIAVGDAFQNAHASAARTFWGGPFRHNGAYHLWGCGPSCDGPQGVLRSQPFRLTGNGQVSLLVSGGYDYDRLYVALVRAADDTGLFKATGANTEAYRRVIWDASAYLGEALYVKLVDASSGGFGHINLDDVRVRNIGAVVRLPAHWSFDEGTGKQALDQVSGSSDPIAYVFNTALHKAPSDPLWRPGINGSALLFDGYSTWIERDSLQVMQPGAALSIEAWVAPRSYEWGDLGQLSAIVNQHNRQAREGYTLGMGRYGAWSFQVGIAGGWYEV